MNVFLYYTIEPVCRHISKHISHQTAVRTETTLPNQFLAPLFFFVLLHSRATVVTGASVNRLSVKHVFSETVKRINAKFWERLPAHYISKTTFSCFSKFKLFDYIYFLVSLTWDNIGVKISSNISSEITHQIHSQKSCILLGRLSTKVDH